MLLSHPQFSPITAVKLCNCFKVTIGLTELGRAGVLMIHHAKRDIQCQMFFNINLPISYLLCKLLENLPGHCG